MTSRFEHFDLKIPLPNKDDLKSVQQNESFLLHSLVNHINAFHFLQADTFYSDPLKFNIRVAGKNHEELVLHQRAPVGKEYVKDNFVDIEKQ